MTRQPSQQQAAVSVASRSSSSEWNNFADVLAEVSAGQDEALRFFGDLFDQLSRMGGELAERQRAWRAEQQHAEKLAREQAAELERQRAALAEERSRLRDQIQAELVQAGIQAAAENERVRQLQAELEQERAATREALQTAQTQLAQLTQATTEIAAAKQELDREREHVASLPPQSTSSEPDAAMLERIRQMEQQRASLEQERAVLETELEAVRSRAVEMAENLARQGRQIAEERTQWADEFKRMRQLLESISQRPVESRSAPASSAPATPEGRNGDATERANGSDSDPVLSSVMAQFEMLQKDMARRRKVGASSGSPG